MKMRLKNGKLKVLTLSYDDGVVQDIRLIGILNKYGIKGTFNINSGMYLPEDSVRERYYGRMKLSEAKELFINSGHEVAIHGYKHASLNLVDTAEAIYEILEDKKAIEKDYGIIARGMAYAFGKFNDTAVDILEKSQVAYARTTRSTLSFSFPDNWLLLNPTCHHNNEKLDELIKKFVEGPNKWKFPMMFYLWGHSYEFDDMDNWEVIEKFAAYAGGRDDIWYATNIEIYDYVKAYKSLQMSYDKKMIHNPSAIDLWFDIDDKVYCIKGGETLKI